MKIAIDCRGLRTTPSGIPNFLVAAINGLSQQCPEWQFYLLTNAEFHPELANKLVKAANVHVVVRPLRLMPNLGILWYVLKVRNIISEIGADLFWAPAFLLPPLLPNRVKTLVTVHDTVYKEHKSTMSGMNRLIFELFHDRSVNNADMLWANSGYTRAGIMRFFPVRKCKDIFTGFFINTAIFKPIQLTPEEEQTLLQEVGIADKKFILFVGTLEPRKNLSFLLSLAPKLVAQGYSLLVVGARGWGATRIKEIINQENFPREKVRFAGFITTEQLVKLYSMAAVYVSTSLNEGFGMPQLEAMACGCPVVSPHNSAMIEVVEGAGETVKTWQEQDWLNSILKVAANRDHYIAQGFQKVESYSREFVIQNLVNYIKSHQK
ncbi:glycosyltransferase family 4 protein [Pontibacter liquoris]|uniref:glycosyltransferase family 4 protein n=1 Tax=Pontibacter liquoris TaxID=2905677 RepID=UPI001FA6D6BD|nr:glycosyltransferase family 1 protein [Pontibacter liquoris]